MSFDTKGGCGPAGETELAKRLRTTFYVAHYLAGLVKSLTDKYGLSADAIAQVIATSEVLSHQGIMSDKAEEYAKLMTEGLGKRVTAASTDKKSDHYCPGKGCAICDLDKKASGGN